MASAQAEEQVRAHREAGPNVGVAPIRGDDIRRQALKWAFFSFIPLGLVLSMVRSFVLLALGLLIVGCIGGGLRWERETQRVEREQAHANTLAREHEMAGRPLVRTREWLSELSLGNQVRVAAQRKAV